MVFAGLVGGIVWNLLTWLLGMPSSSSHALIGGLVGAMLAAAGAPASTGSGAASRRWSSRPCCPRSSPASSPRVGTWLVYRITAACPSERTDAGFRCGQIGSASLVSLAHGTNDAQKTMGVITLALIADRHRPAPTPSPFWVIVSCALAIALGTYLGGWRIIRTLGKGLVEITRRRAWRPRSGSAAVILAVQPLRLLAVDHPRRHRLDPRSGVGKPGAEVRWTSPAGWSPPG